MKRAKVLFIGAHPDDIDLGCAISVHHHYLHRDQITTLVLTEGERGGAGQRTTEQNNSLEILAPGSGKVFLTFPDTQLFSRRHEVIQEIRKVILEDPPDIVYIPTKYDFHQDHVVTHECALAVVNSLPVHKIVTYETPSATPEFSPNFFRLCDVDQFEVKLAALRCHHSQMEKSYFSEENVCSIAKMRATQGRFYGGTAEAYEIIRLVEY